MMGDTGDSDVEGREFELIQSAMELLTQLEEEVDESARLELARSKISNACKEVNSVRFVDEFSEAVGLLAAVATTHGYDDISQKAMELGDEVSG